MKCTQSTRKGKGDDMSNITNLVGTHFLLRRIKTSEEEYVNISESVSYACAGTWKVINMFGSDDDNAKSINSIDDMVIMFVEDVAETETKATVLVEVRDMYDSIMLSELIQKKMWYEEDKEKNPCRIIAKYYTDADHYTVGRY